MPNSPNEPVRRSGWTDIFRCFRIATDPAKVWLGFLGAAFTVLVLIVAVYVLLQVFQLMGGETSRAALKHLRHGDLSAVYGTVREGIDLTWADVKWDVRYIRRSLLSGELMPALAEAHTLKKVVPWALVVLLLLWIPWAYFGGAVNRAAAVEYATGERLSTAEARDFAASRYSSYLWAPAAVIGIMVALFACGVIISFAIAHLLSTVLLLSGLLLSLCILVLTKQKAQSTLAGVLTGFIGVIITLLAAYATRNVGVLWLDKLVLVAVFPLLIALCIPVVLLCVVLVFGRGLMTSTISFEATDAFDSISRAGDYVLKQPWRLAFYAVVGMAYGIPCAVVVVFVALAAFVTASLAAWVGFGEPFVGMYGAVLGPERWHTLFEPLPGFLLCVVFVLLAGLVAGWCVSFIQSFRAICYALIRKQADLSKTTEIYLDADRVAAPAAEGNASGSSP